jgi:hypothetical protein
LACDVASATISRSFRLEAVDQPEHQRQLGPGHDQIDALVPAERDDAGQIIDRERHPGRFAADRIAARSAVQPVHERRSGQRPAQRVLAPARAHDQNLHGGALADHASMGF